MKKILLFFGLLFSFTIAVNSQTVVFSDNFDSYTASQRLCIQNNIDWTTWSNLPGSSEDAMISTEQAQSPSNSLKISGSSDIIYRFANQTTGHYTIDMDYYVPTSGNGGYFNMQHYFNPGQQWAFECYFATSGAGYLIAGSTTHHNFTHPVNAWFHILMDVDLDNDLASLTVNGTFVFSWPYHYEASTTNGINQLGSINLYAGSPVSSSTSGTYYVDNFVVTEVSAANQGHLVVTPDNDVVLEAYYPAGIDYTLNFSNPGGTDIDYKIVRVYDIPNPNNTSTGVVTLSNGTGTPLQGVSYFNSPEMLVGTRFKAENLYAHIGKTIRRVTVALSNAENATGPAAIRIYKMGNIVDAGPSNDILYEQTFTPETGSNIINFSTPYVIDGSDLWVVLSVNQQDVPIGTTNPPLVYVVYDDGTVPNLEGDYIKTSVAWQHLTTIGSYTGSWFILVEIDGTPITPWMATTPMSGTIVSGANENHTFHFGEPSINSNCTKGGSIVILSTDFDNSVLEIPVSITFTTVSVNQYQNIVVTCFPNPAQNMLKVNADQVMGIEIYNVTGQQVFKLETASDKVEINTENWQSGNYIVKVKTEQGVSTQKVMIVK